jgi:SAM-dependent methyltransferase
MVSIKGLPRIKSLFRSHAPHLPTPPTDAPPEPKPSEAPLESQPWDAPLCPLYDLDLGREYCDPETSLPRICCTPAPPLPWTRQPTRFHITTKDGEFGSDVYHPHLGFLKLIKHYEFQSVLDIGCGDGHETMLLRHLGKEVFTINADPNPTFEVDFFGDYLDVKLNRQFDCVWCSHVLEHVRNPGLFLDKIFDDLKEGGVLALSVPYNEFNSRPNTFTMGHHNRYNVLLLLYQLVCAGFDCRAEHVALKIYNQQVSVILRKKTNGVARFTMAPWVDVSKFFPVELHQYGGEWRHTEINWPGII